VVAPDENTNTIVVGIDGSLCSEAALAWAIDEAERSNRSLLLAHVRHWYHDAMATPVALMTPLDSHKAGRMLLDKCARQAKKRGVPVATRLIEGFPIAELSALTLGAGMLVVGTHGAGRLRQAMLGSVSRGCVQRAHCPVVVVPLEWKSDKVRATG
jgi:nucleotide-binding universal stress UspA family protein